MSKDRSLRLGFAGTPEFAARILQCLLDDGWLPELILTQPDRPTGRGRKLQPSTVKKIALRESIDLIQPASLKQQALPVDLDVLVVAAYGLILPPHILQAPTYGCINVHASLLPRWRGAAPIERAIMAGDDVTGVTIMQMDEGLDTGPTYNRAELPIDAEVTGEQLSEQLATLGGAALLDCLSVLGKVQPEAQQGIATYADKLTAADSIVDFSAPATQVHNQIRALAGRMPATCTKQDVRVRLIRSEVVEGAGEALPGQILSASKKGIVVACGADALCITMLQLNRGKGRPMDAAAAINGYGELFSIGSRFDEITSQ
jgi:methionyl-tRNA formyltransferase